MKLLPSLIAQYHSNRLVIAILLTISAFLIGIVLLFHFLGEIPFGNLTRDPSAIMGAPFHTGILSQIGIFFWSASAAICMFTAKVISKYPDSLKLKRFLIFSGLLTMLLALDDIFLLHESVFPYLGIHEKVVYATYAGLVLFYLIKFWPIILDTKYIFLVMALGFFALSVIFDKSSIPGIDPYLLEDGAKIVGIVSWLFYFFQVGTGAIHKHSAQQT